MQSPELVYLGSLYLRVLVEANHLMNLHFDSSRTSTLTNQMILKFGFVNFIVLLLFSTLWEDEFKQICLIINFIFMIFIGAVLPT